MNKFEAFCAEMNEVMASMGFTPTPLTIDQKSRDPLTTGFFHSEFNTTTQSSMVLFYAFKLVGRHRTDTGNYKYFSPESVEREGLPGIVKSIFEIAEDAMKEYRIDKDRFIFYYLDKTSIKAITYFDLEDEVEA